MATSLQHFGRGAMRVAKNYTKGYSDTQTKVRDATSNDPWGPSGTQMNEVAQLTYNQADFVEVMEMLDKRLNDKGKNWRHVFKALTLLDYMLHAGSENVVIYFRDNLYIIKTLKEFVYVDDAGKDVGHNVRQKAKDITNLLQDEERLRAERRQRGAMRDRMLGNIQESGLRGDDDFGDRGPDFHDRIQSRPPQRPSGPTNPSRDEDDDLRRALQASMDSEAEENRRRSQRREEDDDLAKAIKLSEEEEAKRKREQEEATKNALLDDSFQLQSDNQYQQQQQMGMMNTGFPLVDTSTPFQQQLQPQFTSYNPFYAQMLAQQQHNDAQTQEYLQHQQMLQQQQQQLLQQQQQEEYMRQQMMLQQQQQQSLQPQHTAVGSNNPFAPRQGSLFDQPTGMQNNNNNNNNRFQQSSFLSVQPQATSSSPSPVTPTPSSPPKPSWNPPAQRDDGQHAGLANLLARGREDGQDTFGNVGNLRFPTGQPFHSSNRMAVQQTGNFGANNPFGQATSPQPQQQRNDQPFFSI